MKEIYYFLSSPQALILFGGILTLLGAFWSSRLDTNKEKELNAKNQIIIDKTQENADLNAQIVSTLTGGDSFPMVTIGIPIGQDKYGSPTLSLKGDIPLTNVNGKLIDLIEIRKEQKKGVFMSEKNSYKFDRRIISPAYVTALTNGYFDLTNGKRFLIHFYTPYHTFSQWLAIEMDKDGIARQAWKIYKDDELIHTEYPESFPIPFEEIDFSGELTDEEMKTARELAKKRNNKK